MNNDVFIEKTSPGTLREDIDRIITQYLLPTFDKEIEIYIKINANYDRFWPGCNTSLWVFDALLYSLRNHGFQKIIVIEGDLKLQPAINTIQKLGYKKVIKRHNATFLPIESLPRRREIPDILFNAQIISVPVLHTHTFSTISVATKNLFGIYPVYREKYHPILSQKLIEICSNLKIFTIVDGTIGLDGGSMRMGNPIKTDILLAGWNPLTIDDLAASIMGFSPESVPLLQYVKKKNLNQEYSIIRGKNMYEIPKFSFVSKQPALSVLDLYIRNNPFLKNYFSYNKIGDIFLNKLRRVYLQMYYYYKYRFIKTKNWTEYEHYWDVIKN